MCPSHPPARSADRPQDAIRLTLEYEGTDVRVISGQRVRMTAPPSDPVDEYEGQAGFWFELRDQDDRVLYRRVVSNPIRSDVEVLSGDPVRPFTHVSLPDPSGTFTLVVPDSGAGTLVLFGSPAGEPAKEARELVRFDLAEFEEPGRPV